MKRQKSENQTAAHRVLRNIVGRTMALTMALSLGGAIATASAANTESLPGLGVQPVEYFYTGKPYDADSESYTYRYRNYDPELNRWTSVDPSGFPDGANNQYYAPQPFSEFDWQGLETATMSGSLPFTAGDVSFATSVQTTITASWNSGPTAGTPGWANATPIAGSQGVNIAGNSIGVAWTANTPNATISNIAEGTAQTIEGRTFKTYTFDISYSLSYHVTYSGNAGINFSIGGLDLSTGTSGSTTINYNMTLPSKGSITVEE